MKTEKPRTIGEFVTACMRIDNAEDAKTFFETEVATIQKQIEEGTWTSKCDAVEGARANIGYCFGEGMSQERIAMWVKVCGAFHPWFGTTMPNAETAYSMGKMRAAEMEK